MRRGRTPLYLLASLERRGGGDEAFCEIFERPSLVPAGIGVGIVVDMVTVGRDRSVAHSSGVDLAVVAVSVSGAGSLLSVVGLYVL